MKIATIYAAIQGEGKLTGTSMVIVRLQGCSVGCPWCDTKETWDALGGVDMTELAIVTQAVKLSPLARWALVTGGEPAEQDLTALVANLHAAEFRAALETSGTARGHLGAGFNWVTVSPKIDMPGGCKLDRDAIRSADELKFVIGRASDMNNVYEVLDTYALKPDVVFSLQPIWGSKIAQSICYDTALARGWNLSLQTHKFIGQP